MPTFKITFDDGTSQNITANSAQEAQMIAQSGAQQMPDGSLWKQGPRGGLTKVSAPITARGVDPTNPLYSSGGAIGGLSSSERADLTKVRQAARGANSAIADANRFIALNQKTVTGGIQDRWTFTGIPQFKEAINPNIQEMTTITNRLTPAQREAGSGAMSDRDVEMYRASVLNRGNEGPVNQAIAARLKAGAARERDYAAFLDEYAKVNGTLAGAQERWDNFSNEHPLYDYKTGTVRSGVPSWRQYFGVQQQPRQATRSNQPATTTRTNSKPRVTYTPAQMQAVRSIQGGPRGTAGSRTNPKMVMNKAQFDKLPAGTWYIDDGGYYGQKGR